MRPTLRPYQSAASSATLGLLQQGRFPLIVLPTGAGKTVVLAHVVREMGVWTCVVAHRQELVAQISRALAREGIYHRIIAPPRTVAAIVATHIEDFGRSYYKANAPVAVAGVDSLRKSDPRWRARVRLWVVDEAHHVLKGNKWGRALLAFPNAVGFGVTATPTRADGMGLGAHADGLFTHIVEGPPMRHLIKAGHLSDYKIVVPQGSRLDLSRVKVGASGDYVRKQLSAAVRKSRITGDVVATYKERAEGKLAVAFCVDIDHAKELEAEFLQANTRALCVSSKSTDAERRDALRRFAAHELDVLVNVDLFGEGFDLPAIEVGIMVRPTKSWGVFVQQFGRSLRPMPGKDRALIIDHTDNVVHHGLPDRPIQYTLDRRPRRRSKSPATIHMAVCEECMGAYEKVHYVCPYCGHEPSPPERSMPEHVAGDLVLLSDEVLAKMRGEVAARDRTPQEYEAELRAKGLRDYASVTANVKHHVAAQETQAKLRAALDWWGGVEMAKGRDYREAVRSFYLTFAIDTLSARALKRAPAQALLDRVRATLPDDIARKLS